MRGGVIECKRISGKDVALFRTSGVRLRATSILDPLVGLLLSWYCIELDAKMLGMQIILAVCARCC